MRLLLPLLALAGCVEQRDVLDVPVIFRAAPVEPPAEAGVTLALDQAILAIADLRLESPSSTARWRPGSLLLSTAYAHPGHDFAGGIGGELVGTWTLDLLGEDVELGSARCFAGEYATGRLDLLAEPEVTLVGTATPGGGGEGVPFSFVLPIEQEITGIAFEATLDAEAPPEGIALSVDLGRALSFVDWSTPDTDGDGVLTAADGEEGALANTVVFGVVHTPTWNLDLEEE